MLKMSYDYPQFRKLETKFSFSPRARKSIDAIDVLSYQVVGSAWGRGNILVFLPKYFVCVHTHIFIAILHTHKIIYIGSTECLVMSKNSLQSRVQNSSPPV